LRESLGATFSEFFSPAVLKKLQQENPDSYESFLMEEERKGSIRTNNYLHKIYTKVKRKVLNLLNVFEKQEILFYIAKAGFSVKKYTYTTNYIITVSFLFFLFIYYLPIQAKGLL
jgi:hypothetical protein